jgi:hypothetical protein
VLVILACRDAGSLIRPPNSLETIASVSSEELLTQHPAAGHNNGTSLLVSHCACSGVCAAVPLLRLVEAQQFQRPPANQCGLPLAGACNSATARAIRLQTVTPSKSPRSSIRSARWAATSSASGPCSLMSRGPGRRSIGILAVEKRRVPHAHRAILPTCCTGTNRQFAASLRHVVV